MVIQFMAALGVFPASGRNMPGAALLQSRAVSASCRTMWADVPIILHAAAALSVSARVLMRPRLEPPVRLAWVLMIVVVMLPSIKSKREEAFQDAD